VNWHQQEIGEILESLGSSPAGLTSAEAEKRLAEYGPNELTEKKKRPAFLLFLDQFRDFMILVLIAAAIISGIIGELSDTIAIIIIVILNSTVGFVQEYRAEKAIEALKEMASPLSTVIRDGLPREIPSPMLVPGDIVVLEAGNIVPADMRLMDVSHLKIEEAALTGESAAIEKHVEKLQEEIIPIGDRLNMAYKGTFVTYGRGTAIVVSTGMGTELGKIAAMLQEEKEGKTPLQKRLTRFGRKLAIAILAICAVVFTTGILRGEPPMLMLLTAVTLAVAAIPEALPAVITISLALGAKKMVKNNALIRKLPAVETLGSVTYICSDKTGTLTLNKMNVEEIYFDEKRVDLRKKRKIFGGLSLSDLSDKKPSSYDTGGLLMISLALSNDAGIDAKGNLIGDPTEKALFSFARENGFEKAALEKEFPRVEDIPFDSERKCMTTFHKWRDGKFISFTKGAVEVINEKSATILTSEGMKPVERDEILKINEEMAANGLRVLAIAMKVWDELPDDMSGESVERDLSILGLTGMMDPPRKEAMEAVRLCRMAGIKPVMITGDHPTTARVIAERLGILKDGAARVITGTDLSMMSLDDLEKRVEQISAYARVAPEQKLKIVKALQDRGQFVAMTGDGVNDAPALKRADIGIAMGITGTDVSKEASHMILLDDNFATIVKAVKEGRKIYDNIRKFIKYLLATNSGEVWTLFLAPLLGLPLPLIPIQILWINLLTDGLPALALSVEPEEEDVMMRPPRPPGESIFAHGLGLTALWVGLLMAIITLSLQAWCLNTGRENWQSMVFTVLCLSQLGNALALRSEKASLFKVGLLSNKPLLGAVLLSFAMQMAIVYIPTLNPFFRTAPLTLSELLLILSLSSLVFFAVEIEKTIKRWKAGRALIRQSGV
jgi:Ca2+-transporting ATPase